MKDRFIGWCNEDGHDKVWGVITLRSKVDQKAYIETVVTFWGRRGKKLQTKISTVTDWEHSKLVESKIKKGYTSIDESRLNEVYPEFQKDLEKTTMWASLKI